MELKALHCSGKGSDDMYDWNVHAAEVAKARGQIVVYPQQNQLQLDLDSEEALLLCLAQMDAFDIPREWAIKENSRTEGHYHMTITFPGRVFTETERIAYQFALGSDPTREALNLMRAHNNQDKPTRLFKTPL